MFNRYQILRFVKNHSFLLIVLYVCYHLFSGSNGLISHFEYVDKIEAKQLELAAINQKKDRLVNNISLLKGSNIDADMLDEQLRRTTGFAKPNEIIIYDY